MIPSLVIWAMLVEDVAQRPRFWDISLANVVTWLVLIVGFLGTHYVSVKLLTQRMNSFDEWVVEHKKESNSRDKLQETMGTTIVRLSVLSEAVERRLEKIEDRPVYARADNPPPYYGTERRRK